jgi:hypothetical protein
MPKPCLFLRACDLTVHAKVTKIATTATEGDEVEKPHAGIDVDLDAQKSLHMRALTTCMPTVSG